MTTPAYHYSNVATTTALVGSINSGATMLTVETVAGYPGSFPWVAKVDEGTPAEELVLVTSAAGEVLTVERAFGGTSAQSHGAGAEFKHVYNAVDAADFRDHEASAAGVHGVVGDLVGTGNTQTLSNKTLTAPVINSATLNGSYAGTPTYEDSVLHEGELTVSRDDPTDPGLSVLVDGDDHPRLRVTAGGVILIGDGSAEPDIELRRAQANVLETLDIIRIVRALNTDNALQVRMNGDDVSRLMIRGDGRLNWGPGNASADTNLYRSAANVLRTDGAFHAAVTVQGSGITAATGFQMAGQNLYRTCGIATISFMVERTGSNIDASAAGNITDVQIATIPAGWRPAVLTSVGCGDGFGEGETSWSPTGTVNLRTWSGNGTIQPGRNIRVSATYILPVD